MKLSESTKSSPKIGLLTSISLVAGNMIGSGIFLLPAALAVYGGISMLGWIFSGMGAILLALVFSRLSRILPKAGGPYAYTREGYGDFAGFLVAWGYWVSVWTANGAIAVTFTSYLSVFFPILAQSQVAVVVTSLTAIWLLTWVNSYGTVSSGRVQVIFTILKLVPLILLGFVGIFFINFNHFTPFNLSTESDFSAITATATLTLWALLGMESATIPADDVKDPSSTIPKATILGTLLVIVVYLFSSFAVFGLISPGELQNSTAPFADAAFKIWGNWGKYMVSLGAIAATFGALNGWILLQGQVPMAIARDNLFPSIFKKTNKRGAPVLGLIISSVLISISVASTSSKGLVSMYTFMILLGTITMLVPYLFCSLSEILILYKMKILDKAKMTKSLLIGIPAFLFSMWAISGSTMEPVFYGFLLLMAGIPIYIWAKIKHKYD